MLFLVIFEDDKNGNFLRGDDPLERLNALIRAKIRINDVTSNLNYVISGRQ